MRCAYATSPTKHIQETEIRPHLAFSCLAGEHDPLTWIGGDKMDWTWHWWLFVLGTVVFTPIVQFSRGFMNTANIQRYGERADYQKNFASAFIGSILAGALYAAVITAVAGFIF